LFVSSHALDVGMDEQALFLFASRFLEASAQVGEWDRRFFIPLRFAKMKGDIHVDITILLKYLINFNYRINSGSSITQEN